MSISLIILTTLILIVMFGAGQRILDRMRMNDKWALAIMVAIVIGIIIPPISFGEYFTFSIGGFLIPLGVCIYLLVKTGWSWDLFRAFVGSIITGAAIVGLDFLLPSATPQDILLPNLLVYGLVAGIVAYSLGRSRRNAFICSIFGFFLASLTEFLIALWGFGVQTNLSFGVAGAFDAIVISSLIAVGLAELVGKTVEALAGKKEKKFSMETGEFVEFDSENKVKKSSSKNSKKTTKGKK